MQDKISVFDYDSYRDYLISRLNAKRQGRGMRTKLASQMAADPSFLSRALAGKMNISLEHVPPINKFLGHSKNEASYFMLLVLKERSATPELRAYFEGQIRKNQSKGRSFSARVKIEEKIDPQDQALYCSFWYYPVIHMLVALPQFSTIDAISLRLGLDVATVAKVLNDLARIGLVQNSDGFHSITKRRIHIEKNSAFADLYHTAMRLRAVSKIDSCRDENFHFSLNMGVSKEFILEYRKRILSLITEFEEKMVNAKEEDLYNLNIDLYRV